MRAGWRLSLRACGRAVRVSRSRPSGRSEEPRRVEKMAIFVKFSFQLSPYAGEPLE